MVDLISELIKWDQEIFLRNLFHSLDLSSLRNCKKVSHTWRYFLSERVLGCAGLRSVLVGRLWEDLQTEDRDLVVGGSVTSIGWDKLAIVCGYSDGTAEVFAGECITRLSDVEEGVHYTGSRVYIGKDIIVKIAFGSDDATGKVVSDVGVWSKRTGQRIFKSLVDEQDTCLHARVVDNMVFYRTGSSLTKIDVNRNDVVQEDLKTIKDLSKQDFLTDGEYFVFRSENKITRYKAGCDVSEAIEVTAEKTVLVMTMTWPNVVALHGDSFSVVNFTTKTIEVKGHSSTKLVSIHSNLAVVAVMNCTNQIHFYNWAGTVKLLLKFKISPIFCSRSGEPHPHSLLPTIQPTDSHTSLSIQPSLPSPA